MWQRTSVLVFSALWCGACGDSGNTVDKSPPVDLTHPGPIIDEVAMPATATASTDGYYHVQGSLRFHDTSAAVITLRVHLPMLGLTYDIPLADHGHSPLPIEIRFLAAVAAKSQQRYDILIIDDAAVESRPAQHTVDLQ